MGKYDDVFNTEETSTESLSPEEGVAAIAIVTVLCDPEVSDLDIDYLVSLLWELEVFEDYSDDEMSDIVNKLLDIAESEGLGALFNAAYDSLLYDLVPDAFAAGVMMLVDDSGAIPAEKRGFLNELQQSLEMEAQEAQQIVDEVVAAFNEAAEEEDSDAEYADAGDEKYEELEDTDAVYAKVLDERYPEDESSQQVYESPAGNFIVPVPVDPQKGGIVNEQEGTVGFSDDFGCLLRIDYYPLSPEEADQLESVGREEYLRSCLVDNYVAQAIVANIPNSKVEHTEYLEEVIEGAYFVVVDMPQGSTLYLQKNNGPVTRLDALRALLSFQMDDFLYVVSCQRTFFDGETPAPMNQEVERLKDQLLEFLDTVEFIQPF